MSSAVPPLPPPGPEQLTESYYETNSSQLAEISREDILRQVFGDVGDLIDDFSCAVETTVLLHGRMYVTSRFLCFYSNLFGLEKKIRIPYSHITQITKENTVLVIPNAIAITTYRKEYLFRSFWDRDECFRILKEFTDSYRALGSSSSARAGQSIVAKVPFQQQQQHQQQSLQSTVIVSTPPSNSNNDERVSIVGDEADSGQEGSDGELTDADDEGEEDDEDEEGLDSDDDPESDTADEGMGVVLAPKSSGTNAAASSSAEEEVNANLKLYREEEKNSRLGISVASAVLPVSVAEFAALFVEDEAQYSWLAYHERVNDTSLECSAWKEMRPRKLGSGRELKFFKPVNLPGLKSTRGIKVQRYKRFGNIGLIVCSSTRLEDVPAADTFSVEDTISVRRVDDGHVRVEITFEIKFLKTTIFRFLIEKSTTPEMTKWLELFFEYAQQRCLDHSRRDKAVITAPLASMVGTKIAKDVALAERGRSASADSAALKGAKGVTKNAAGAARGPLLDNLVGGRVFWTAWLLLLLALVGVAWQWRGVNARLDRLNARLTDMAEGQRRLAAAIEALGAASKSGGGWGNKEKR